MYPYRRYLLQLYRWWSKTQSWKTLQPSGLSTRFPPIYFIESLWTLALMFGTKYDSVMSVNGGVPLRFLSPSCGPIWTSTTCLSIRLAWSCNALRASRFLCTVASGVLYDTMSAWRNSAALGRSISQSILIPRAPFGRFWRTPQHRF